MNATDQQRLDEIESWIATNDYTNSDVRWLISQLKAAQNQWQDIATAPKDGTVILTYSKYQEDDAEIYSGWWQDDCWHTGWVRGGHRSDVDEINPTHWQPLPQPPKI